MKHKHKILKKEPRFDGVAPPDMLRQDFAALDAKTILRCSYDVEQLLLMQAVEGHAHEGHGEFHGKKYPNTTVDDIARSLRLDPEAVKEDRQELIDEIREYAGRLIDGEDLTTACNTEGEPLMRFGAFRHLRIEPKGVLQGLYLGGLRDEAEIRDKANKRYGVEMGYGRCSLVDQEVLRLIGLNGFDLARKAHEHEIQKFERAGLFVKKPNAHTAYMYVRYQTGPGASDDAAIVMCGKMYGLSAAVGCFFADAIDTLEKYVPDYRDQDSELADYIARNYKDLGVTKSDAVDLAYLCSIPREMQGKLPDDSLRHMLQIDRNIDQCPLDSHFAYIAGRPYSVMDLDHGECTNKEFYAYVERRLSVFESKGE